MLCHWSLQGIEHGLDLWGIFFFFFIILGQTKHSIVNDKLYTKGLMMLIQKNYFSLVS